MTVGIAAGWLAGHTIVAEGGLGTGIVAALAHQLNALVVTKSGPEDTSVSIAHHAVKAV